MKNKKRGFTLTELIAVIVVLAIIMGISVAAFINIRNRALEKEYENMVSYIETQAAKYAKDTGITTVSVQTLIDEGYLTPDDETDIYNPINKESLNCYVINSLFEDGDYESKMGDDLGKNNDICNAYEITTDYVICNYKNDEKAENKFQTRKNHVASEKCRYMSTTIL